MEKRKVVIWGHKLHSHTHSYIHYGYFKAFTALGFDTYWFDNKHIPKDFNFENCIFLTEGQVDQKIPLIASSAYILHHCDNKKYNDANATILNLCNYVNDCRLGKSYNYEGGSVEKLTYYSYIDRANKALYQPWATDLLPDEISNTPLALDPAKRRVYYVGSIWRENKEFVEPFKKSCKDHKKKFVHKEKISDEKAIRYIRESYIAPDIRGEHHINVGYMPCRIFKNISYGVIPATNSHFARDFFGDNTLPYSQDTYGLFEANERYLVNQNNIAHSAWLIQEVKNHHTYITRAKTILSLITPTNRESMLL